jgi:hypothetical protein
MGPTVTVGARADARRRLRGVRRSIRLDWGVGCIERGRESGEREVRALVRSTKAPVPVYWRLLIRDSLCGLQREHASPGVGPCEGGGV